MKHLFSPFKIKRLDLKNRIVLPPLASFLIRSDGSVTAETIEHYKRRAAGGPAMVITEACAVSPEGVVSRHQARMDEDRFIEQWARLAAAMKSAGAVPAVQLHHAGRQTSAKIIKQPPLAPSALPCPYIRGKVQPLSVEQIRELVQKFVHAAIRAREAGFELIEVHGGHGYLVNQFLSRHSNIREDEYGRDVAGRCRFAVEIVSGMRQALGHDFPISFKISAQEFVPDGLTVDESIQILQILVSAGIDVVQVSAGNDSTPEWICQPMFMKKACLADSAETVKKALGIPVMTVGRINDPVTADSLIAKGKADLVCIGRGLMADPQMPVKAREGRFDEIRTCIACNTCMESIFRRGRLECLVNPSLGREKEMQIIPADKPRRIMVVGGGPAGMNAAWVAAKRGHDVHLYEKLPYLGGQLVPGSKTDYKQEMLSLIRFQKKQIELNGVKCHLNQEVTADTVKAFNPNAIVLATGSRPVIPAVENIGLDTVVSFASVLNGNERQADKTVVIGGGATGCEVAYHLARQGSAVTIVEMLPKIGGNLESITKRMLIGKLKEMNVAFMTGWKLSQVAPDGVVLVNRADEERFVQAGQVVIAMGIKADVRLHKQIEALGFEIHRIGDCLEARTAKAAIYESAVLGRNI